jgi:hypothetical protein
MRLVITAGTWLLIFSLFYQCSDDVEGAEVKKAAIEFGSYYGKNHDPYLLLDREDEQLEHTPSMIMNVDVICTKANDVCIFWDNTVLGKATTTQYRGVGWDFRVGLNFDNRVETGVHHYSYHELDRKSNRDIRFPLENTVYIQFKFIDKPRGKL